MAQKVLKKLFKGVLSVSRHLQRGRIAVADAGPRDGSVGKGPHGTPDDMGSIPSTHTGKERVDSHKLFFDLHVL